MKTRRLFVLGFLILAVAALAWLPLKSQFMQEKAAAAAALMAGRNVNMVSGTTLPDGDPWLQRQNEPSIAVSTRNPQHLLAGANDYRTVDMPTSEGELPGIPGVAAGDAWLGVFKSFDGGESWMTSLLPGFPQDSSKEAQQSPLKKYSTAADPVVRAATNGLFYYAGISFDRSDRGKNVLFVARYIDNNNVEGSDPIAYIDTSIVEKEGVHQFIDKPWIAVDKPRSGSKVSINGQSIPASNAYIVFAAFPRGAKSTGQNNIFFSMTEDCGKKWSNPVQVSQSGHVCQGATVAVDPSDGEVFIAWRQFDQSAIWVSKLQVSKNKTSFSPPQKVASCIGFDQVSSDGMNISIPGTAFRTNSYPTMAIDGTGRIYIAWAERDRFLTGSTRIVLSSSQSETGWTLPQPVHNPLPFLLGHQLMPTLAYGGGKLLVSWYDQCFSAAGPAYGFGTWIKDDDPVRETIDVLIAQADPGQYPQFEAPVQVSRYLWGLDSNNTPVQLQYNPPNFPLFKGGTTPFHGDYIDISPSPAFVLDSNGSWQFNTATVSSPVYHVAWTDNRDVRPPSDNNWRNYNPPASDQGAFGSKSCGSVDRMGMRNQNIYTAKISNLEASAAANYKTLGTGLGSYPDGTPIPRMFVLYVKNPAGGIKSFRLHVASLQNVQKASFLEFEDMQTLDVTIGAYSTIARPLFVTSTNAGGSVTVGVVEIDVPGGNVVKEGLSTSIYLNPDPTNPPLSSADPVSSAETHTPNIMNPNIMNWVINPNIMNPNIMNPNIMNPNIMNPNIMNPNVVENPNIMNSTIANPNIMNPNIMNPNIMNPNIMNPNIMNPNIMNVPLGDAAVVDVTWRVKNEGNTATSFTFKMFSKEQMPAGIYAQLLVYRVHKVPGILYSTGTGSVQDCKLREEEHHELLLNVPNPNIMNPNIMNPNIMNPNIMNPNIMNTTFSIPPGEEVLAVLRVLDPDANSGIQHLMADGSVFDPEAFCESVGTAVVSHAVNTSEAKTGDTTPPVDATELIIATTSLPDGKVGIGYSTTLEAFGGKTPYSWSFSCEEPLPAGWTISADPNYQGLLSGTFNTAGLYHFIVRVDDADGDFDTQRYSIYVYSESPGNLTITTTSLPQGTNHYWYGASLEATGGAKPYSWRLASGTLPPGLSLDNGGAISGTPNVQDSSTFPVIYPITVRVKDANGGTPLNPTNLSLTINAYSGISFTISGTVYDGQGNLLSGVVMHGLPHTPVTVNGYYEDTVPKYWSGTVMPIKANVAFNPPSRPYQNVTGPFSQQNYNEPVVGLPTKLAFKLQPGGGIGGQIWAQQPVVEVQDSNGNPITSDDLTAVALTIRTNPGDGALFGIFQMTVTDGEAEFSDLSINKGGYGYTLEATSSPVLQAATSDAFGIEGFSDSVNTMSSNRSSHTATSLGTDMVLIAGGFSGTTSTDRVVFYNPSNNIFTENVSVHMTETRGGHTATSLLNGKILIAGGNSHPHFPYSSAEIYDPDTGNFVAIPGGMIYPHIYHRATLLQDGRVLITGNQGSGQNKAEIFDPSSNSFSQTAVMTSNRSMHTATLLPNGKVLITGGREGINTPMSAELFDPDTGTFTEIDPMPGPRWNHQATLLDNGTVLITGGWVAFGALNQTAEIYDPTSTVDYPYGRFLNKFAMLYEHQGHQAALLRDGTVLLIGGNDLMSGNEIYDPATGTFRATGPMSGRRTDSAAAVLPDGRVLVTGGQYLGNSTNTAEVWNPLAPFPTHVIRGTITHIPTGGVGGVMLNGLPGHPLTNPGGYYEGLVLHGWSGTVTPAKRGFAFNPSSRDYALTPVTADTPLQDYTATSIPTYTISGTVTSGGSGLSDVVMNGFSGTVRTDGNGIYTTMENYGWSGTVTPAKNGYMFTPPSQMYSNVTSNQTTNYTAVSSLASKVVMTGPSPIVVNTIAGPYPLQSQDSIGNPANVVDATVFALTSNSSGTYSFYSDAGGGTRINEVAIASGTNNTTFYYKEDFALGTPTLKASRTSGMSFPDALLQISVVVGPVAMVKLTGPASVGSGFISEAFTITSTDASGFPANVSADTVFNLASSTVGPMTFYSDPAGTTPITQVTIPSGQSSAAIFYMDNVSGARTVTATWISGGTNLGSSSRNISVRTVEGQVVFASNRSGSCEIYIMNADGTGLSRLTYNSTDEEEPYWSPDGNKIVFTSHRDGNAEIYVMNADGSWQTRLTNNSILDGNPCWSPYGKKIAFHRNDDIYVMNADGTNVTNLTNNLSVDHTASWSPDGSKIAFVSERDGNAEIYVMNADGTGLTTRLTNNLAIDCYPCWSPDGNKIAFASYRNGNFDIYVMDANGTGQTPLTTITEDDLEPNWSPDGRKILFSSKRDGNSEIYVMNADGTGQTRLMNNTAFDGFACWGGYKIAIQSTRTGSSQIFSMYPNGTGLTRLTINSSNEYDPSWSPDRKKIAFSRYNSTYQSTDLYIMNADGTGQTVIIAHVVMSVYEAYRDSCWSPDGTKLAVASNHDGNGEIYIYDTNGTELKRLTNSPGVYDGAPCWSPDGTKIAFVSDMDGDNEIYFMNADGTGTPTKLTNNSASDNLPSWSQDGTKIVFESYRDGKMEIYVMNAADGSFQTRLTTTLGDAHSMQPCWSPNGRHIVFSSNRDGNYEIYIMNADGTQMTRITNNAAIDTKPRWKSS